MSRVLGLDIGATGSRAQLCVDGEVVAESKAASASVVAVGEASAKAALTDVLSQLPLDPQDPLDAVCAGSAGVSARGTRQFLVEHLAPLARPGRTVIVKDATLILPAAGLDEGVALICGTGSVAIGTYEGREMQCGGWGYLLGDEGSGYWMVRAALRVLLERRDHGALMGDLGDRLFEATGTDHIGALQGVFYSQKHARYWAGYAPVVLSSADPAASVIIADAADALAALAVAVCDRLDAPPGLPIVLSGGLFRHVELETTVRIAIEEARPGTDIRTLAGEAVTGAVRLAQAAARRPG